MADRMHDSRPHVSRARTIVSTSDIAAVARLASPCPAAFSTRLPLPSCESCESCEACKAAIGKASPRSDLGTRPGLGLSRAICSSHQRSARASLSAGCHGNPYFGF
ncbi:uncharacterized protein PSANT_06351 [Moesziomyces antarcticus]|uniref:Uncharacterized protein n=1 Tax=Pseudozyma antarctica TaxID=84753 RepID=A0A5C3FWQ4_PSEA2|nr:uncharacterized protein PSANT_06351 [Moesziomyces antarcticus]